MPGAPTSAVLSEALRELGLELPPRAVENLVSLARLVESWGARLNLTGHRDADSITRRLVVDAAALLARITSS